MTTRAKIRASPEDIIGTERKPGGMELPNMNACNDRGNIFHVCVSDNGLCDIPFVSSDMFRYHLRRVVHGIIHRVISHVFSRTSVVFLGGGGGVELLY